MGRSGRYVAPGGPTSSTKFAFNGRARDERALSSLDPQAVRVGRRGFDGTNPSRGFEGAQKMLMQESHAPSLRRVRRAFVASAGLLPIAFRALSHIMGMRR
jgi:hypothetical protein